MEQALAENENPAYSNSLLNNLKNNANLRQGFNTTVDPMREVFGSAEESNPEELANLLEDLHNKGV